MTRAIVNDNLKNGETTTIHRFELAGLGKGPFRFTGAMTEKVHCVPGCAPKAGSSCDYCGTGIRYEFWVVSADNKTFKVGCDCIHKTGDRGLIQQITKAERELRDMKNKAAKERKIAKLLLRIEAAKELLKGVRGTLNSQPHPNDYFAREGKTLLNYVEWCLVNAAEKACLIIETAHKTKEG